MRTKSLWLGVLLMVFAGALTLGARRSLSAAIEVAPDPARPGEALAVTTSLTNNTNALESVTVSLQMRGPCGVAASKAYKVLLAAHGTDTSKAAFQAPSCPGGYEAVMTVSDDRDGILIGSKMRTFEVINKSSIADAK